jgi:hypothetical protein
MPRKKDHAALAKTFTCEGLGGKVRSMVVLRTLLRAMLLCEALFCPTRPYLPDDEKDPQSPSER